MITEEMLKKKLKKQAEIIGLDENDIKSIIAKLTRTGVDYLNSMIVLTKVIKNIINKKEIKKNGKNNND